MKVNITFPSAQPAGTLYRVKRYDEMLAYYDINYISPGASNFGYVQVHVPGVGEGSIAITTTISAADVLKLRDMQYAQALTVDQKMNTLIYAGKYVRPMWTNVDGLGWKDAPEVRAGACVYTNQKVMIDKFATMRARKPGVTQTGDENRYMGRLVCFKPSDWGKTFSTHPWLIHHFTGVSPSNVHSENPHGEIFIPLFDPAHFRQRPESPAPDYVKEYWIDMEYVTSL